MAAAAAPSRAVVPHLKGASCAKVSLKEETSRAYTLALRRGLGASQQGLRVVMSGEMDVVMITKLAKKKLNIQSTQQRNWFFGGFQVPDLYILKCH